MAAAIGKLIREKRPKAGYFNYMQESTDGIMSESNTAVRASAAAVALFGERQRESRAQQPARQDGGRSQHAVRGLLRGASRRCRSQEIALRMWQNMANGGALTFEVNGTLDLQDRQAYRRPSRCSNGRRRTRSITPGMRAPRACCCSPERRVARQRCRTAGIFRLLTRRAHSVRRFRQHGVARASAPFDLVIATDWAPRGLQQYVEEGGHLLIASSRPPEFSVVRAIATTPDVKGYVRVRNHAQFPSLADTDLLLLDGPFTTVEGDGANSLSLVPPSMIGPPEKVHVDMRDTSTPAIVSRNMGRGSVVWLPWELGALYYRHSLPAHAGLFHDVVDRLYPQRQLKTNAHPLVEVTLMRQGGQTQLHLINLSGHSQTGYFSPVPMHEIRVELLGGFHKARALRGAVDLKVQVRGAYSELLFPS